MGCRILSIAGLDASSVRWRQELSAAALYPSGSSPAPPFQRLAVRSEPVHRSPIGLLIHPRGGSGTPTAAHWYCPIASGCRAWRRPPALAAPVRRSLACPPARCRRFAPVRSTSGMRRSRLECSGFECRERGCRARRACPVGAEFRYVEAQARFHMRAFLRSARPSSSPSATGTMFVSGQLIL